MPDDLFDSLTDEGLLDRIMEGESAVSEFIEQRNTVKEFISTEMMAQGASRAYTSMALVCVDFWNGKDVQNLFKCINSDLEMDIIKQIVAHDYNGLSKQDKFFLPKSSQFGDK